MPEPFQNRTEAGERLAEKLQAYANRDDVIVLALPRGGVPVAREVAQSLKAPLDVYIVRKVGVPGQEELAMGAIASGGAVVKNARIVNAIGISDDDFDRVAQREREELRRREQLYRDDRPSPEIEHKTVLLVDDGLATGASMRAAVEAGIYVPEETVTRAIRFVKNCYHEQQHGFTYQTRRGDAGFARTGAGLVSLQTVGLHNDPTVPDIVEYLVKNAFNDMKDHQFWYGHYYTSVALYHYGGDAWKGYYPKIANHILKEWGDRGHHRDVLTTSWAILILGVPYRYLPIYQR